MRLIDADALEVKYEFGYDHYGILCVPYRDVNESIKKAKTVDAVPVVRCRDCKYRGQIFCPMIHETMGNGLLDYTVNNGYCNRGKRKDTSRSEVR